MTLVGLRNGVDSEAGSRCGTSRVRPPAAYWGLAGPHSAARVAEVRRQPGALGESLVMTPDGTILDGHARWAAANAAGHAGLACLEHNLAEYDALAILIARHSRSFTLNAFCRVGSALQLELHFKRVARERVGVGGAPHHNPRPTRAARCAAGGSCPRDDDRPKLAQRC